MKIIARHYADRAMGRADVRDGPIAVDRGGRWPRADPAGRRLDRAGVLGHPDQRPVGPLVLRARDLTVEQVAAIVRAQAALGTARLCPTLITAPVDRSAARPADDRRGLRSGSRTSPAGSSGIHLEGPFISELDGYRGAHPAEAIRDPDWDAFQQLQDAAGGRIVLITLAPERPGAIEFIRESDRSAAWSWRSATPRPTADADRAAVAAGARLSHAPGQRHRRDAAPAPEPDLGPGGARRRSVASFIADGHHLDLATLRVLARAKGPARTILVSDASPLAGLPPGRTATGPSIPRARSSSPAPRTWPARTRGSKSACGTCWPRPVDALAKSLATVTTNPARLLGRPEPPLKPGEPAQPHRVPPGRARDSS